jgi:predicted O-methyltransferase YrrM
LNRGASEGASAASKKHRRAKRGTRRAPAFSPAEAATWYEGKSFTFDWTSWHFPNWVRLLRHRRERQLRVLEIGSWEGRSALFFLNHLPRARLTCIDTFAGGQEHREAAARTAEDTRVLQTVEKRFDANTRKFKKRIEKIKANSTDALVDLGLKARRFDVAYIDGGHRAAEVYADGVLTWPLMARGGLVIFDDYQWDEMPQPLDNPKPGIDAFLQSIEGQYRVVLDSYQIGIVKR